MKTLTIISKYELTNEEKHIIQDIYYCVFSYLVRV